MATPANTSASWTFPDPRRDEFVALLQARASELITTDEAKGRLKTLFPEWFENSQDVA